VVDPLMAMRGPNESYSDVIFEAGGGGPLSMWRFRRMFRPRPLEDPPHACRIHR
jgi:hypothetical protein